MATIFRRKGSPCWYISFFHEGKRITRSLKTVDRASAVSEKKKLEGRIEERTHEEFGKHCIREVFELYKADKSERKELTNKHEFYTLKDFIAFLNKRSLDAIKEVDVLSYLAKYRDKSPVTYKNVLGAIKRFFKFAAKRKKISAQKNPAEQIDARKIIRKKPTFLTDEEYLRIEKAAEGHPIYPMIVTARYTGLRLAELRYLEWEDFDWAKRVVAVKNKLHLQHTVKTYEERNVPIPEQLIYKLLTYRKETGLCFPVPYGETAGQVYSIQGPKRVLKRLFKTALIKNERDGWHKFRRTFASRLVQEGIIIEKVSKWLGHSGIAITEKFYADFKPRYDADIEKLNIRPIESADKSADSDNSNDGKEWNSSRENWGGRRELNPRPQDPQS